MKHVVHLALYLDRTGRAPDALLDGWPTLVRCAQAVAGAGWRATVVLPSDRDRVVHRDGVDVHFVGEWAGWRRGPPGLRPVRSRASRLFRAVAALEPDVVHVHGLALPGHARRLRRHLPDRVRILAQDHADRPPRPWRRRGWRRDAAAWDAVTFTARAQAAPFVEAGVLRPDIPVFEVLEASTDFTPGDVSEARSQAGVDGAPCLAWVGRLDRNKDPLTVLDGFARAADRLPDARLHCCFGDAPLLAAVRARVEGDRRLAGRVRLHGPLPHPAVQRLLRGADALVLGSHREAACFALLEAMACGATPVVTDIHPFRRIVGDVGMLWPVGDARALADALVGWWARRDGQERTRVLRRFRSSLSWPAVARELDVAYRACLAAPRTDEGAMPRAGSAP